MAERTVMHLSFAVGRVNISQCMVAASLLRVATLAPKVSLLFCGDGSVKVSNIMRGRRRRREFHQRPSWRIIN